jgi:hypothetical protein
MPTLSVSTANKQHAVLTLDSGTKPSGTEKYQIERKESSVSDYLLSAETTSAVYNDHPRPRNADSTSALTWDYRARAYLTASGWSSYSTPVTGNSISPITDTQVGSIDVLGAATSAGTFSNTYITNSETIGSSPNQDKDTLVLCEIIPLTTGSV